MNQDELIEHYYKVFTGKVFLNKDTPNMAWEFVLTKGGKPKEVICGELGKGWQRTYELLPGGESIFIWINADEQWLIKSFEKDNATGKHSLVVKSDYQEIRLEEF